MFVNRRVRALLPGLFIPGLLCMALQGFAKKGMLPPPAIKKHEAEMKAMGLQIPVEKLYNADGTGLNNAVILFGRGCTGEVISPKGLVLTNHHCGYGTVQGLSNATHDYFAHGYWAKNLSEEIPCPGLTVTFVRKVENVTDKIITGLADTLNDIARDSIIAVRIKNLEKGYKVATGMDATIKPYYTGNEYWVTLSETYKDIRLVGFPPNGIGGFGGDVENWSWPRHTGDFSMFRIYAGANNKPAAYATSNKPYQTKDFFTLNANGYKEGDMTMVYGFPAVTKEYISSYQLNQIYTITDPIYVNMATKKLQVWNSSMKEDRDIFLKYTAKRSGVANGWKKMQGEMKGLQLNNAIGKKEEDEKIFQRWAVANDTSYPYAQNLLTYMQAEVAAADNLVKADAYINSAVYGVELIQQGASLDNMLPLFRARLSAEALQDTLSKIVAGMHGFYKNYDAATDQKVFAALIPEFFSGAQGWVPAYYSNQYELYNNDFPTWAAATYKTSILASESKMQDFAKSAQASDSTVIMSDPAWHLYHGVAVQRKKRITPIVTAYASRMQYLNRLYMNAQMHQSPDNTFFPDANFTLRLSYGKVKGIDPDGPAGYSYQTNLDETVALDDPNVDEFKVPEKLKELQAKKNYGKWAANGTVPVAFIADNHTSGGNSGSPVLNAKGELIGTNFDRVWEGTMSDLYFDPAVCRNITLDVRYTLFIIEKFGDAGWLLKEMKIVQNNNAAKHAAPKTKGVTQ